MSTPEQRLARRRADTALAAMDRVADRITVDGVQHITAEWDRAVAMRSGIERDLLLANFGTTLAFIGGVRFQAAHRSDALAFVLVTVAVFIGGAIIGGAVARHYHTDAPLRPSEASVSSAVDPNPTDASTTP